MTLSISVVFIESLHRTKMFDTSPLVRVKASTACPNPTGFAFNIYTRNLLSINILTVIYDHKVYDVQSAAPPLADTSIIRVHIALVPTQIVVPEH